MTIVNRHLVIQDRYRDSVSLLALADRLRREPGVADASVVMATATNLELVADAGFPVPDAVRPSDLLVSVRGEEGACAAALALAPSLLDDEPDTRATAAAPAPRSLARALERVARPALALISVPGPFAAAEAAKALCRGAHVMLFSDNVSLDDEVALKGFGAARDLLVMGPDCGTAIIDGVPLGFANVVRRGPIGVIGASGTGLQEVVSRIHRLGSGVAHAIGTGGRDLSDGVGGRAMRQAIAALADDPATEALVLVSKPPSPAVMASLLAEVDRLRGVGRLRVPVVGAFLGSERAVLDAAGLLPAPTLAAAADLAVALTGTFEPADPLDDSLAGSEAPPISPEGARRFLRAGFCGGTFAYESQLVWRDAGLAVAANGPLAGNAHLALSRTLGWPPGHGVVDFGADDYTVGRPHPMIDPSVRDEALVQAWRDPATAVVLFDVVLGHGSAREPVGSLVARVDALHRDEPATREVRAVAHVCGTDRDPQDRSAVVAALRSCGVTVAGSNADAAAQAARAIGARA